MTAPNPGSPDDVSTAEKIAQLMAQHGGARYADVETIAACLPSLPRTAPPSAEPVRTPPTATERS